MGAYENLYKVLLENGELKMMFPSLTGEWVKDKKRFISQQKQLEEQAGIINVNGEED